MKLYIYEGYITVLTLSIKNDNDRFYIYDDGVVYICSRHAYSLKLI